MRIAEHSAARAALVVLLSACGAGATPQPPGVAETTALAGPPDPIAPETFFIPGEVMRFELSLRGVVGGESTVAVGEPGELDGKRVVIVRSQVTSAGVVALLKEVRDEVTTWIDVDTGSPVKHHAEVKFGDKESVIDSSFNRGKPGSFLIDYARKGRGKLTLRQVLPQDQGAYDVHAIMGVLRAWQGAEGDHAKFYIVAGRRLWQNTVRVTRHESIRTSLGRYPAIRIDGIATRLTRTLAEDPRKKPRSYTLWISDDADRLPLEVKATTEYGDVKAELVDYDRPQRRYSLR